MAADFEGLKSCVAKSKPRSPFAAWMRRHFLAFRKQVEGQTMDWSKLAAWVERQGYTDGKPIKPLTARKVYERERVRRFGKGRNVKRWAKAEPVSPVQPAPVQAPKGVRILTPDEQEDPASRALSDVRDAMKKSQPWLFK